MEKKWNLQDIKRPEGRKRAPIDRRPQRRQPEPAVVESADDGTMHINIADGNKKKRFSTVIVGILFVVIVAGGFLASYLMSGAEVIVEPRYSQPTVNAEFTAYGSAPVGELSYEIMLLEAEGERQVSATGQETITEQATGVIEIFKTTAGTQRLVKNTRFESPEGRIYKIQESVVVPGAVDGTPGTIRANIFADVAGEDYNLTDETRFTVPGLESDPELFDAIYALNEGPVAGGFEGEKFIIDDVELETAKQALQMELRNALLERVPSEKPAGFVVFDEAVTFTYETLPAVEYGQNLATIKEKAVLQIPLFKREDFAGYLAEATIPGYEGEPVRVDNYSEILFGYSSPTTSSTNIANLESVTFQLVGKPTIVWTYDEGKLATDLLGTSKTALNQVLSGYPAIEKAEAVVRPFWKRSFPTKLEDIVITESIPGLSDAE